MTEEPEYRKTLTLYGFTKGLAQVEFGDIGGGGNVFTSRVELTKFTYKLDDGTFKCGAQMRNILYKEIGSAKGSFAGALLSVSAYVKDLRSGITLHVS